MVRVILPFPQEKALICAFFSEHESSSEVCDVYAWQFFFFAS